MLRSAAGVEDVGTTSAWLTFTHNLKPKQQWSIPVAYTGTTVQMVVTLRVSNVDFCSSIMTTTTTHCLDADHAEWKHDLQISSLITCRSRGWLAIPIE